jgi:hypothetical protein
VEAGCIICKQEAHTTGQKAFAGVQKRMTPLNVFLKTHLEYITFQRPSFVLKAQVFLNLVLAVWSKLKLY